VSRGAVSSAFVVPPAPPAPTPSAPPPAAAPAGNAGAVTSPMVGTAYLQAEPGAPPFVSVGATVKVGDTLVIIEAMKVMNPIKAPRGGVVRQVLIADGQPVEYGEPLMIVE
jgi:acetyl-CoA carboxylase biotin carboxyl carrier protein